MDDNSTQKDDLSQDLNVSANAMDDAIGDLLDAAVDKGVISPATDEYDDDETTQNEGEYTEESDDQDLVDEDAEEIDDDLEDDTTDEDEAEDEDSTQEAEDDEVDDDEEEGSLDMEYMVPVKVDGESSEVSIKELIKGYQTNQHQTKQGRKLAEQAKELEQAKESALLGAQVSMTLLSEQDTRDKNLLSAKKDILDRVAKGEFIEGVDDDLATLQYKYKSIEDEYNKRKASRDSTFENQRALVTAQQEQYVQEGIQSFQERISDFVPDWTPEMAVANQQWAIDQGIPAEIVNSILSPEVAKVINDARLKSEATSKGAVKRKKAPFKKAPVKKPVSNNIKKKSKSDDARKRLAKGKGSTKDKKVLSDDVYEGIFEGSNLF